MKQSRFYAMLAVLAWGGIQGFGQNASDTNRLTLESAIRLAQENNPEIRMFEADIAVARGSLASARTWQNPDVSFAPGFSRDASETMFHGDFGLEQTFEWPGKRELRRALAEKNVKIRRLALDGFRSQLAIQVRRAFFSLMMAQETIALREQRISLAQTFIDVARKRVGSGIAPEFESTKAEVELVAARKELREAQSELATSQVLLNSLMGRDSAHPVVITGQFLMPIAAPDEFTLKQKAMTENPPLKIREMEVELAGLNVQSIRKSRLPDFKAGPQVEFTRQEQIVGLGISLPLPLWDRKQREMDSAHAEEEKALAGIKAAQNNLLRDVAIAFQHLLAAQDSLALHTPALHDKLQKSLDAAAQSYSEGRTPLLLYLETRRAWFDTQSDYLEARRKCFESLSELESALGVPLESVK